MATNTILVLGAGGLVGAALARQPSTVGLERAALDLRDPLAVARALDLYAPQAVLNAAARANVDGAERDPDDYFTTNGTAVGALARACRARGVRLVHLSTDYVLDHASGPLTEDLPAAPRSTYARTKLLGEQLALEAGAVVVRVQWVYHSGHAGFFTRSLRALAAGQPLRLVTDQRGCPTPADLLAPALLRAARGGPTGLFHLATTGEATPWDWIAAAAQALDLPFRASPALRADLGGAWRPARSCLDCTRFAAAFGLRLPDWETALVDALRGAGRAWLSDPAR